MKVLDYLKENGIEIPEDLVEKLNSVPDIKTQKDIDSAVQTRLSRETSKHDLEIQELKDKVKEYDELEKDYDLLAEKYNSDKEKLETYTQKEKEVELKSAFENNIQELSKAGDIRAPKDGKLDKILKVYGLDYESDADTIKEAFKKAAEEEDAWFELDSSVEDELNVGGSGKDDNESIITTLDKSPDGNFVSG